MGVLGVAGDWSDRDAAGAIADHSAATQRGHCAVHAGRGSVDCGISVPLFRYAPVGLWLLEAEALLLIGVWTKEVVFRRLGMLAALLVSGQMIAMDAARIFGRRMDDADLRPDFGLAIVFVVAAAVFYANAHWVLRRWADLFAREPDRRVMQRLSYAAAVMLLIAAWIAFPESWTAVAWCTLGLGLALAGHAGFGLPGAGIPSELPGAGVCDSRSGNQSGGYGQVSRPDVAAGNSCACFRSALHHIELEWRF